MPRSSKKSTKHSSTANSKSKDISEGRFTVTIRTGRLPSHFGYLGLTKNVTKAFGASFATLYPRSGDHGWCPYEDEETEENCKTLPKLWIVHDGNFTHALSYSCPEHRLKGYKAKDWTQIETYNPDMEGVIVNHDGKDERDDVILDR